MKWVTTSWTHSRKNKKGRPLYQSPWTNHYIRTRAFPPVEFLSLLVGRDRRILTTRHNTLSKAKRELRTLYSSLTIWLQDYLFYLNKLDKEMFFGQYAIKLALRTQCYASKNVSIKSILQLYAFSLLAETDFQTLAFFVHNIMVALQLPDVVKDAFLLFISLWVT